MADISASAKWMLAAAYVKAGQPEAAKSLIRREFLAKRMVSQTVTSGSDKRKADRCSDARASSHQPEADELTKLKQQVENQAMELAKLKNQRWEQQPVPYVADESNYANQNDMGYRQSNQWNRPLNRNAGFHNNNSGIVRNQNQFRGANSGRTGHAQQRGVPNRGRFYQNRRRGVAQVSQANAHVKAQENSNQGFNFNQRN